MNGLFTQSGVLVGFEFSGDVGPRFSERILDGRIEGVAIFVAAGLFDKSSAGEEAVARVALEMAGEVVGREQVRLRADVERPGAGSRAQQHAGFVVEAIAIGCSPEEILLERERKPVHRAHGGRRLFKCAYFFSLSWRRWITKSWISSGFKLPLNGGILFLPLPMTSASCASDSFWTSAECRSGIFILFPTAVLPLPSGA